MAWYLWVGRGSVLTYTLPPIFLRSEGISGSKFIIFFSYIYLFDLLVNLGTLFSMISCSYLCKIALFS